MKRQIKALRKMTFNRTSCEWMHRSMESSGEDNPWICVDGLVRFIEIPAEAKKLHVALYNRKPSGSQSHILRFEISRYAHALIGNKEVLLSYPLFLILSRINGFGDILYASFEWS